MNRPSSGERGIKPPFHWVLRSTHPHLVPAERRDLLIAKAAALRRFLDHSAPSRCLAAAIDHLPLIDQAEQPFDLESAVVKPIPK